MPAYLIAEHVITDAAKFEWFRERFEGAGVGHELHFVDVPDDVCKGLTRPSSGRADTPLPLGAYTMNSTRTP